MEVMMEVCEEKGNRLLRLAAFKGLFTCATAVGPATVTGPLFPQQAHSFRSRKWSVHLRNFTRPSPNHRRPHPGTFPRVQGLQAGGMRTQVTLKPLSAIATTINPAAPQRDASSTVDQHESLSHRPQLLGNP